jgi:hypothetical protein
MRRPFLQQGRGSSATLPLGESRASLVNRSERRAALLGCPGPRRGGAPASTASEMSSASTRIMTLPDPAGAAHLPHALPRAYVPHVPGCMYQSLPPSVLSGASPPGAASRTAMEAAASPRGTKPEIVEAVDWQIREGVVDRQAIDG